MCSIKGRLYILILLMYSLTIAQDASSNSGAASVLLLRLGPNPRISGFSEAFCGLADDENALYYNPAGLSNINSGSINLNHTEWFEDIRIENFTFGYKISKQFGIGTGFTYMWVPAIMGRDNLGQATGSINVSSSIMNLGISYRPISELSAGVGIKYFRDKLSNYIASGVGFDAGLFFTPSIPGLSVGFSVQNLGARVGYIRENQKIPLTFRGGVAYKLFTSNLLFTMDVVKSIDTDLNLFFGGEYTFNNQFSLSIGNKFTKTDIIKPSFGAGFHVKDQYHIYYTFIIPSELGGIHQLGFSFNFKVSPRTKPKLLYDTSQPIVVIPPENVKVEIYGDELKISWGYLAGVQYNIYGRQSTEKKWVLLNKSPIYNNSMNYKKPKTSGNYYFCVCSVYKGKESTYSKDIMINVQ
jgi:hypothetical protein